MTAGQVIGKLVQRSLETLPHRVASGLECLALLFRRMDGDAVNREVVLPSCSVKVVVLRTSSGQVGLMGCRFRFPSSSVKDTTKTSRSGATISRYTNLPHMARPSGDRME